ncbi:putative membrane protein [Alicyclobacillus sacchari]|uniref:Putative membrane protein n=1 Tax=Alicyclobacillus sacchari TaxID=392010 RepID=A0A4R8LNC0_9BACL|nr:SdpI family protein [Alicyclobacillus sacchari]TDY45289.1 putative membrane protein [Alicyclobacillus sacchari]GMA56913.1 hypothetical protein GCM10025858_14160 [Alicyclobacillus sacchari]
MADKRKSAITWWGWAAWVVVCAVSAALYPQLLASVATDFDVFGKPNGYMSRFGATIVMPLIMLALIGCWHVLADRSEARTVHDVLANYLPRVSPNWLVGIRTPWTLASDEAWRRTHRAAGALGVVAGLLCVVCAWVVPLHFAILGTLVIIFTWAAAATVLSYVYFRRG